MDKAENLKEDSMERIDNFIKCQRCKRILKYNRRKINNIDKNKHQRICDHCINEYLLQKTNKSRICKKNIYKESTSRKHIKEKVKLWLSKIIDLLDNNMIFLDASNLTKQTHHSAKSSTKTLCSYKISFTTIHEPKIELMFKTTDDILTLGNEKPEKINKRGIKYYEDTSRKGKISEVTPLGSSDDELTLLSETSRTKRAIVLQHKLQILKKEKGKGNELIIKTICNDKSHEERFTKHAKDLKQNIESYSNLSDDISSRNICSISTSFSSLTEKTSKTSFSYFFPKERIKKLICCQKRSSEIIKEVIEMLSTAELEKTKKEQDRKSKIAEEMRQVRLQKHTHKTEDEKEIESQANNMDNVRELQTKFQGTGEKGSVKSKNTKQQLNKRRVTYDKSEKPRLKFEAAATQNENEKTTQLDYTETDMPSEPQENDKDTQENQENDTEDFGLDILKAKEKEMRARMKNKQRQEKEKSKTSGSQVHPTTRELSISKIKLRKPSTDDLVLQLVQVKHSDGAPLRVRPKRWSELNISPLIIKRHRGHKLHYCIPGMRCLFCENSELELDIDNILYNEEKVEEITDVIKGTKIRKNVLPKIVKPKKINVNEPLIFNTKYVPIEAEIDMKEEVKDPVLPKKQAEKDVPKGVMRYALSDRSFIDKGWTILPTENVVRQLNIYRMRPAYPEFDWFKHNKNKKLILYDTGEKLAEIDDNGKGRWFYRNGRKALDYYDAEETHAQQRYVVYSNGESDDRGRSRPLTILAMFDYLGNGIVFDHKGKIRLKYNQTEGVVLDRKIGPASHWKWHTLNDPPILQQIMIDTHLTHKDPDILAFSGPGDDIPRCDNEEMVAIEFDNFIKEKSKKLSQTFEPFEIKMKALKINENFSLKVLGQDKIYLIFRDGSTNLKLNMGMILDHKEIVDTDIAEVGEVSNSLNRYPPPSSSLAGLQNTIEQAKRIERARLERVRRIRPKQSYASVDKLRSGTSKPLRKPFVTAPSDATTNNTSEYQCKCRKPSVKNLYYDTRLI